MGLKSSQPVFQQADTGGGATSPFSSQTAVGGIVAPGCHECECELIFAQVMEKVLRVKNMCSDDVCRVEDFRAFRRRNLAISADYADIYLQPLGEAKRLKFAGGAAFGSTHIGYALDLAADTLEGWGSTRQGSPADLVMPDGTEISPDWGGPTLDLQELVASIWTGVGYEATRAGLRRLVYGNLAIYTDLGAVLWFCQLHEQRFNYFRDGRVDEFMECFERFVKYVNDNHANDHHTFGPQGSFGSEEGGYLRQGLRALAEGNVLGSLAIVDHEQRNILENFMYTLGPGVPSDVASSLGSDAEFANFMNALETVQPGASSGYGTSVRFNGIRAQFSFSRDPYFLTRRGVPLRVQPLMFAFDPLKQGNNFANPNVRTPWFKAVVNHWVEAERNHFQWPTYEPHMVFEGAGLNHNMANGPPDLERLLYSDLGHIRSAG